MKLAKLILFTFPVMLASLLFLINPATAGVVQQVPVQRIELVSEHPTTATIVPRFSDKSNPITDAMGCSCSACVRAKLQLEGKLSLSSLI